MKKWIIWIVMIICAIEASAARLCPAHGRVVNEQGKAIEYATVVLLREGRQVAGMATDADGRFQLEAAPGQYALQIQYLGCEPLKQLIRVEENNDLGDFVLRSSPTQIEDVCSNRPRASGSTARRSPSTAKAARRSTSTTAN